MHYSEEGIEFLVFGQNVKEKDRKEIRPLHHIMHVYEIRHA